MLVLDVNVLTRIGVNVFNNGRILMQANPDIVSNRKCLNSNPARCWGEFVLEADTCCA